MGLLYLLPRTLIGTRASKVPQSSSLIIFTVNPPLVSEQTETNSVYNINRLVFITETKSVYCAVRTGSLTMVQINLSILRGLSPRENYTDRAAAAGRRS
jgi:L-fucose mutarotase/ribose pyranase (RbsD/FucU family)